MITSYVHRNFRSTVIIVDRLRLSDLVLATELHVVNIIDTTIYDILYGLRVCTCK